MTSYENWTREDLIRRVRELEATAPLSGSAASNTVLSTDSSKGKKHAKPFDFSQHPSRKIALKFCYFGWEYNGLAFQNEPTPLPTVEGALLDALIETRLIDAAGGMDGCGWSRCGRTDRGVSAAGQVIALYVRSAIKTVQETSRAPLAEAEDSSLEHNKESEPPSLLPEPSGSSSPTPPAPPKNEINYVDVLNRVLPSGIRILAWSPVAESFDARFSCSFRHYKYFFDPTNLDLESMKDGVQRLEGEHDFRNLCKVDPSKQIVNYRRLITRATITPVEGHGGLQVVDIVGNGFLYHQVRHILAVLLLIGGGFEKPSIVSALMNTNDGVPAPSAEGSTIDADPLPIVDRKPEYQMADGLPLVLWECGFKEVDVDWRCDSLSPESSRGKTDMRDASTGPAGLINHLRSIHQRTLVEFAIQNHFLQAAEKHADADALAPPGAVKVHGRKGVPIFQIPLGAGTYRRLGKYIPLLERDRNESVEVVNARWLATKGARRAQRQQEAVASTQDNLATPSLEPDSL